jgi:hypothetical protein
MFKDKAFRVRDVHEVFEDIHMARARFKRIERIFLADGDALCLSNDKLMTILRKINSQFPELFYPVPGKIPGIFGITVQDYDSHSPLLLPVDFHQS